MLMLVSVVGNDKLWQCGKDLQFGFLLFKVCVILCKKEEIRN